MKKFRCGIIPVFISLRKSKVLLAMKLTILVFLIGIMQSFAIGTYAQVTKLNLKMQNSSIKDVLAQVEEKSEFYFLYNSKLVDVERKVNVSGSDMTIIDLLNQLFADGRVTYNIVDRQIVLSSREMTAPPPATQQQGTVTGRVTDKAGAPLPGVTVVVKGTTTGTITDNNGNFSLTNVPPTGTLVFSFVGMRSQEVVVGNQANIIINLEEEAIGIEEVVAIGYGTMKKKDLTGSVGSVRSSDLDNEAPKNIQQLLRSNIAGLNVGLTTSAKGGGSIEIRGRRTLKASASPLIVLDGVIYNGSLDDINPNDIESVDVLKDASSAAVYGAKSANGVVIVNTKLGKSAKPTVGIDINTGFASLLRSEEVYSPTEFIDWRTDVLYSINRNAKPFMYNDPRTLPSDISVNEWLAYDSSQGDPVDVWLRRLSLSDIEIANYKKNQSTDWKSMVFRTGLEQNYNINLSGKTDLITYYWSLGYTDNEGVVLDDDYSVYRSRLRLEAKVTDFLSVGLNSLFSVRDESGVPVTWSMFDNISPWGQPTNDDGTYKIHPTNDGVAAYHPLINTFYTDRSYTYKAFDNVIYAKIKLPFNISYELNYAPRFTNNELFQHQSAGHPEWSLVGGNASRNTSSSFSWQVDNLIKWNKTFNDIHQVDVTLLANSEKAQAWSQNMSNKGFVPSDVLGYHFIGSGTTPIISSNDTYSTGDAYMGRLFYSFKSKYLLTGTVRRDGYSAFGIENPRATFPSAAFGWIFTEEPFFKSTDLSYGKLRLSWGANGNRSIGIYDALSSMANGMITYANASSGAIFQDSYLNASRMGNKFLRWEKTTSYNLGIDLSFFENAISTNLDFYSMDTKDLLVDRSLPSVTGYSSVATNLGHINNRGFELTLNTTNIKRNNFNWKTSVNFSLNRNEIKSLYGNMENILDESGNIIGKREADDINNKWFIGHAIDEIWDYEILGVWQIGEEEEAAKYKLAPGDFKLNDFGGDYKFTNDDKKFLGYQNPRFRWSLRNDFSILKDIDFSFSLYSYWGHKDVFNEAKHNPTMTLDRFNSFKIPYWTAENPRNDFARLNSNMAGVAYNVWWDRSFIRLDNISVSYNFPKATLNNYKIQNLKILLTARNVAVWTKDYTFWDPEYTGPTPSYVTLGIRLSL